jgi:uncharacterized membrane protein
MEYVLVLRWLHIIGATVLLGTGAGIAFFMWMAHRTRDAHFIAATANTVVVADIVFTATAVIAQPITGYLLANAIGWPLTAPWLIASIALYVVTGLAWLPVVWIQVQLRRQAHQSARTNTPLMKEYFTLFNYWFACGVPAFASVLTIVWLMVAKPSEVWPF